MKLDNIILMAYASFTLAIAIFSWLAARSAKRSALAAEQSALAAERAIESSLLSSLISEYASGDMLDAMRTLGEVKPEEYVAERKKKSAKGLELDRFRRRVVYYFNKIHLLDSVGFVGPNVRKQIGQFLATDFFVDKIAPIERAHSVHISELSCKDCEAVVDWCQRIGRGAK